MPRLAHALNYFSRTSKPSTNGNASGPTVISISVLLIKCNRCTDKILALYRSLKKEQDIQYSPREYLVNKIIMNGKKDLFSRRTLY